jgi:hypothetical protein
MLFFRDFGQTKSTTEETIDIIMLIPSNNIKIEKAIKILKYLQKGAFFNKKKQTKKRHF